MQTYANQETGSHGWKSGPSGWYNGHHDSFQPVLCSNMPVSLQRHQQRLPQSHSEYQVFEQLLGSVPA